MDFSEESLCFHYQLGLSVASWAGVESALAGVAFHAAGMNSRTQGQLLTGFYAIENFRSKLAFVDAVVIARISAARLKKWEALVQRTSNAAKARNRIAHGMVLERLEEREGRRIGLARWSGASVICVRDLVGYRLEFDALAVTLQNYSASVFGGTTPFPASLEQPQITPSLRILRDQLREALLLPPRSSRR
jgi:hypothetical protein